MIATTSHISLRPPSQVMRLKRLGSFHQTRLSFMRSLLRRLKQEKWQFSIPLWRIDNSATGVAVYTAQGPTNAYSLVAFAHNLPDQMRSDRVIATAWDATFCLFDGIPSNEDIQRLSQSVPRQEAGRIQSSELSLSRANKSVRLWNYVVDSLAQGVQPDRQYIDTIGYLMRTTAVYGSGKFGALDRDFLLKRDLAKAPFHLEMLSVYLTRWFVLDLLEHAAQCKGGSQAVRLVPEIRRSLGIGNSTGLGMAPFIINHPVLLHHWIIARETALQQVRSIAKATPTSIDCFREFVQRALHDSYQWNSEHPIQQQKNTHLRQDLKKLNSFVHNKALNPIYPWDSVMRWSEKNCSMEGQEKILSLLLEPQGALVDSLCESMAADEQEGFVIDTSGTTDALQQQIERNYQWIWKVRSDQKNSNSRFWYVSEEKLEPRIGWRETELGAEKALPFDIAQAVQTCYQNIQQYPVGYPLADFLQQHSELRHIVRRILMSQRYPYAEIQDNLVDDNVLPIDLLRCKLSFFGATKFDPRSDRWMRICMYQNAPLPQELAVSQDDWSYPVHTVCA